MMIGGWNVCFDDVVFFKHKTKVDVIRQDTPPPPEVSVNQGGGQSLISCNFERSSSSGKVEHP